MAIVCIVGPWFLPHPFTTIYPDYVRMPPSLAAYPEPEMIETALKDAVRRARVTMTDWNGGEDERIFVTVSSAKPIDERIIRYLDRSDTFNDARVESKSADGLSLTMSATVEKEYFYLRHRQ